VIIERPLEPAERLIGIQRGEQTAPDASGEFSAAEPGDSAATDTLFLPGSIRNCTGLRAANSPATVSVSASA
jgi:hypothetical protein